MVFKHCIGIVDAVRGEFAPSNRPCCHSVNWRWNPPINFVNGLGFALSCLVARKGYSDKRGFCSAPRVCATDSPASLARLACKTHTHTQASGWLHFPLWKCRCVSMCVCVCTVRASFTREWRERPRTHRHRLACTALFRPLVLLSAASADSPYNKLSHYRISPRQEAGPRNPAMFLLFYQIYLLHFFCHLFYIYWGEIPNLFWLIEELFSV